MAQPLGAYADLESEMQCLSQKVTELESCTAMPGGSSNMQDLSSLKVQVKLLEA